MPFKSNAQRKAAFANMNNQHIMRETPYQDASQGTAGL